MMNQGQSLVVQDFNEVKDALIDASNAMKEALESAKTNFHRLPDEKLAEENKEDIKTMLDNYTIRLANEEAKLNKDMRTYQHVTKRNLEYMRNLDNRTVNGALAISEIQKNEEERQKIKELTKSVEKRLNERYLTAQTTAQENNLTPYKSKKFEISSYYLPTLSSKTTVNVNTTTSEKKNTTLLGRGMEIKPFYGNIESWPAFDLLFKATVTDNTDYSDVEKHNILKNHLRSYPLELVEAYCPDGSEFKVAYERLTALYGSADKLYEHYWSKLNKLPVAREHPESLRTLHNNILAITKALKKHKEVETLSFQTIIKEKIPKSVLIECLREEPTDTTTLLAALDKTIERLDKVYRSTHPHDSQERNVLTVKHTQKKCKFCQKSNHTTNECRTVATNQERVEFIKKHKLCFNCMNNTHRTNECTSKPCRVCHTKHNFSICPKRQNGPNNFQTQNYTKQYRNQYNQFSSQNNNQFPQQQTNQTQFQKYQNFPTNQFQFQRQNHNSPTNQYQFQRHQNSPRIQNQFQRQNQNRMQNIVQNPGQYTQTPQNQTNQYQFQRQNQNRGQLRTQQPQNKVNNYQITANTTSLIIANAPIKTKTKIDNIPILLDTGADQSFILKSYAEEMELEIIEKDIEIDVSAFGKDKTKIITDKVTFDIVTEEKTINVQALTVEKITDLFEPTEVTEEEKQFLRENHQTTTNLDSPQIPVALIGIDIFWHLMSDGDKIQLPTGRFVVPTHIGNLICGKQTNEIVTNTHALITRLKSCTDEEIPETKLEEYFELSNIGITAEIEPTNEEVMLQFKETVEINPENKRIVISLPWKEYEKDKLADNRDVAFCRLRQQFHSTHKKNEWKILAESMEKMEKTGIIEETEGDPKNSYYIPYQQVENPNSNTTPARTVFDASSKKRGEISLNNALNQGPTLIPNLQGVLLRIRQGKHIMTGDIEKAFHMIEINEKDRDSLRFLWLKDHLKPPYPNNIRIMRFKRLPFGVNCAPYLLTMSIKHGIQNSPTASEKLKESIDTMCYVDNIFITSNNIEEIKKLYQECKTEFTKIGMNIREFSVNEDESFINEADKAKNTDNIKFLGYIYDKEQDTLQVKLPKIFQIDDYHPKYTKKDIVSIITRIFDPLNTHAPLYLEGKKIIRNLSNPTIKWNSTVTKDVILQTIQYNNKIANSILKIQRHIEFDDSTPTRIAVFSDASKNTYGACLYIIINNQGQSKSHLLIAKQRMSPKQNKLMTIPKLELMAILIGTRLLRYVLNEIKISLDSIELYTDSTIALGQIRNQITKSEKHPIFTENRCREIMKTLQDIKLKTANTQISISHVPTDQNPADHITRGCVSEEQLQTTNWYSGPKWLTNPSIPKPQETKNRLIIEVIEEKETVTNALVVKTKSKPDFENEIIPLSKQNNINKSIRVTAYILRFLKNKIFNKLSKETQCKLEKHFPELKTKTNPELGNLIPEELDKAEQLLIRQNQKYFEITPIRGMNQFFGYISLLTYQCYRADGIGPKPIIHTKSELAKLIIRDIHQRNFHAGPATTLGLILDKYDGSRWRQAVKSELKKCALCRKRNNHSFREAPPGNLPERRTQPSRPFQHVGIDFMGPIKVREWHYKTKELAYIALFTCASSRLIHLEVVKDLKTDEFMLALSRFMSRRGYPESITTDNAATFTLTSKIMSQCSQEREDTFLTNMALRDVPPGEEKDAKEKMSELEKQLASKRIKWHFNTSISPWQGGFFERLVGITKKALKHALGDENYHTVDLETIVIECESIVNRRPITYVDVDNEDIALIRPIDLITPAFTSPILDDEIMENEYAEYTSRFRRTQKHIDRFWKVFHRDYIKQYKNIKTVNQPNRSFSNLVRPVAGEIVLLVDDKTPRDQWKVGKITEVIEGRDGEIRSVHVETTVKKRKIDGSLPYTKHRTQKITRPLRLVIPLEIRPIKSKEKPFIEKPSFTYTSSDEEEQMKPKVTVNKVRTTQKRKTKTVIFRNTTLKSSLWKYLTIALMICLMITTSMAQQTTTPKNSRLRNQARSYTADIDNTTTTEINTTPETTTLLEIITTTTRRRPTQTTSRPETTTTETTTTTEMTTTTESTTTPKTTTTTPRTTQRITTTTTKRITTTTETPITELEYNTEIIPETTQQPTTQPASLPNPRLRNAASPREQDEPKRREASTEKSTTKRKEPTTTNTPTTVQEEDDEFEIGTKQPEKKEEYEKLHFHESKSTIECTIMGAKLVDEEHTVNNTYSICTENWCDHEIYSSGKTIDVVIPAEYTTHKHKIVWKKTIENKNFAIIEKECPSVEYCTKVEEDSCILCSNYILNPHCHKKTTIAIVIILILLPLKFIITCHQWHKVKLLCNLLICCKNRTPEPETIEMIPLRSQNRPRNDTTNTPRTRNTVANSLFSRIRTRTQRNKRFRNKEIQKRNPELKETNILSPPRHRTFEVRTVTENGQEFVEIEKTGSRTPTPPMSTILTIATIIVLIAAASADVCDQTIPITHDEIRCNNNSNCIVSKIEDIFIDPQAKTICMQLVSKKTVVAKIKVSVNYNFRKCNKDTILFTKNVTVHSDSSKRCHGMGECVDRKCLDIGPNSKLLEFPEGNKYPGITYCATSCGGLWCKCLLPTEACLFYRTYAKPTSEDKFQIYACESWSNKISFTITTTVDNVVNSETFMLQEGSTKVIADKSKMLTSLTLKAISEESGLSVLGKKFIQNKEKVALASITNEIFPLECDDSNNCAYRETCTCNQAETVAICNCKVPDLYKILDDKNHNLPIITERYQLGTTPDNVPAIKMKHSKLHIQLKMKHSYNISVTESNTDCSITQTTPYIGCYNCLKGASQNVTCESRSPTHAKLSCDNDDFIDLLTCDKKGIVNEIHRKFNNSKPTGVCTIVCGTKNNSYKITGKLTFVAHDSLIEYLSQVLSSEKGLNDMDPIHIPDFWNVLDVLSKGLIHIIIDVTIFLALAAIIYLCCIPALIRFLSGGRM